MQLRARTKYDKKTLQLSIEYLILPPPTAAAKTDVDDDDNDAVVVGVVGVGGVVVDRLRPPGDTGHPACSLIYFSHSFRVRPTRSL